MATWQFDLYLIPRAKLVEIFGEIPACVERELWESADWEHWDTHVLREEATTLLDETVPRIQNHWSETVSAWGSYDGDLVEVTFDGARIESFRVRVDLREPILRFVAAICEIGSMTDCYLLTEDMRLIEPRMEPFLRELRQSTAFRFVTDPKGFLDSFHGMPRLD